MKNLGVICPSQTDATSFYRGFGPLGHLRKIKSDLSLVFTNEFNWAIAKLLDGLFLQRPFTNNHLKIAEICKHNKLPLWVDFDDDLFEVPEWNPCCNVYKKPEIQNNIATIIAMADVVSVSTKALKDKLLKLNKNIYIVPNAFDSQLIDVPKPRIEKEGTLVFWRGSNTHRNDLNIAAESCVKLAKKHPAVTWFFLGDNPWFVDYMPHQNVICAPAIDPIEYWQLLEKLNPNIMIVPLVDCAFNHAKSNIAMIEGAWAGAAVIAPDWEEWKKPGVLNYSESNSFESVLDECLTQPKALIANNHKTWHYVNDNLRLTRVNTERLCILKELGF